MLADHWDEAHPRGEDGDFAARVAQIATLDDGPVVILPMQYAPLLETQRDGALPYRAQLVALGETKARDGENLAGQRGHDSTRISAQRAIWRRPDRRRCRSCSSSKLRSPASVRPCRSNVRSGFEQALNFHTLSPLVDKIASLPSQVSLASARSERRRARSRRRERGGALRLPRREGRRSAPSEFTSLSDVDAALGAALGYFETQEPSSAAALLIGQTRQLLGKNLYEVMKLLAPTAADNARIFVGAEPAFTVPVSSLAANGGGEPLERQGR